jgi:hypothetical protein
MMLKNQRKELIKLSKKVSVLFDGSMLCWAHIGYISEHENALLKTAWYELQEVRGAKGKAGVGVE